ncbi:GerAB/ArcD/ProY family transporter, partial [Bacillus thuringiensis]|nr:GerAB/ArcD/ProY family transporter [Bacillus thuringiensis]
MKPTASISSSQLFFFILQSQVGISILSMPYATFRIAKTDSWLVVILSGFVVQVFILIIWILGTKFPNCTVFEIQEKIVGKTIGKVITGAYIVYFLLATSQFLSVFSNIIKLWLLPTTPSWLLILLMLGFSIYMVKENLQILSRFFVLTAMLFVLFLLLILYSFKEANILYILPIGKMGIESVLKGMWQEVPAFLGFEMLLILFPYVKTSNITKLKVTTYANICTTCFYTLLTVACLLFFSPEEMEFIPQPVLYATKS